MSVLTTAAFLVACGATAAYFAGIAPGVSTTLPVFTRLVAITTVVLVVTALVWSSSLLE